MLPYANEQAFWPSIVLVLVSNPPIPGTKRSRNRIGTMAGGKFRFAIDRGGTFTDVYSECPNGEVKVMKLLSVDPAYPDAPREGIRRILEQVYKTLFVTNYQYFKNI